MNKKAKKNSHDEVGSCCDPGVVFYQHSKPFTNHVLLSNKAETKEELFVQIARMLFDRGLITGVNGAMAWRVEENTILVSPMQQPLGFLNASNVVRVSLDGKYQNGMVPGLAAEFLSEPF